jgi:cell division protein FtsA
MAKTQNNTIAALDIGSAKTVVLISEMTETGLRYRGHGVAESRGSRKGVITEMDKAVYSIQRALELAEKSADRSIGSAMIGVGGAHIKGITSRGGVALGPRPREVTRDDIRAAVEKARSVHLPPDREILHLLPQEFILDDQGGVRDPAGMMGRKLELNLHMVTSSASATQNLVTAANRAGVNVDNVVYEGLVSADSALRGDEKDLGVCLADIGAGSTEVIVYWEGMVTHTGAVPVGGDHFTNDVAVGLRTPIAAAEKVKKGFGTAVSSRVPSGIEIEIPEVGERPSRLVQQSLLAKILEPRAIELCEMLRDHLRQAGVLELCPAGLVLVGGGSRLRGLAEIAERVLDRPVRLASPAPVAKMPAQLAEPEFATALGMTMYAHRTAATRTSQENGLGGRLRTLFARLGA